MNTRTRINSISYLSRCPMATPELKSDTQFSTLAKNAYGVVRQGLKETELDISLYRRASDGTESRRPCSREMEACNQNNSGNNFFCESDVCFQSPANGHDKYFKFNTLEEFVAERTSPQLRMSSANQSKGLHRLGRRSYSATNADIIQNRPMAERSANLPAASSCVNTKRQPRRFNFFSSKRGLTVDAADIGDLVSPGESFHSLFDTGPTNGIWWLDILNPTEGELNALVKAFSVHPLTSEDIKMGEIHEKVEVFKHYYFVCFRSFHKMGKADKYHVEPLNVYILVFREGTLSITFGPSPHAANVQNRIHMLRNYMTLSSDWICYALIDDIVDSFSPLISAIEQETNAMEDSVFVTRVHDLGPVLSQVHVCRKKTMSILHLLRGKAVAVKSLARHCDEISLFLGDIQDHLMTMKSKLDHYEEILSRLHSDYLTRLSLDKICTGNQTMKLIIKITVIAAVLVPLNVICGLFGMNVRVPGGDVDGLSWWFGILGAIILIILASLAVARRMKLI